MDLVELVLIIGCSVLPAILYLAILRRSGHEYRLPWREGRNSLIAGATIATILGIILSAVLLVPLYLIWIYLTGENLDITIETIGAGTIIAAVIVAPLAEELTKGITISIFRKKFTGLESGLLYGAIVGLGFAVAENILYGIDALSDGLQIALGLVLLRAVSSMLGHAGYSAIVGYGIARAELLHRGAVRTVLPYYLLAVLLHAFSNMLAVSSEVVDLGDIQAALTIIILIVMDLAIFILVWRRAQSLDRSGPHRSLLTWPQLNGQ